MRVAVFYLNEEEARPALVLKRWSPGCANLVVFFDGANDRFEDNQSGFTWEQTTSTDFCRWITSVPCVEEGQPKAGRFEYQKHEAA